MRMDLEGTEFKMANAIADTVSSNFLTNPIIEAPISTSSYHNPKVL